MSVPAEPDGGREPAPASRHAARPRAPRLDPLAVRRQLRESGLRARHALSQNFLADPDVLQAILDLAAPAPGRRVIEVGPGLGVLTGGLLEGGAMVTAVELDPRLAERLRRTFATALGQGDAAGTAGAGAGTAGAAPVAGAAARVQPGSLRLVEGDILDQQIGELVAAPFEVVANVPYHITSPLLHRFLAAPPRPDRLVLMLQREVAERIAARPGAMSYLSVFVQYHARVEIAFVVRREAFEPAPDVDSAVVVLEPVDPAGERPRLDPVAEDDLWRLVQAGFRERRKMLRNVLSRQLPVPADRIDGALAAAGLAGERRPQTLGVDDWLRLHEALGPLPRQDRRGPRRTGTEGEPPAAGPPAGASDPSVSDR